MMIKTVIQKANYDDLSDILDLQRLAFIDEVKRYDDYQIAPLKQTLEEIQNEYTNSLFLKATFDGQIVGSIRGRVLDSSCWVGRLMVSPEIQNRGIGRMLLTKIEDLCPDINTFTLFTGSRSEKNIRLYESVGYTIIEKYLDEKNPNIVLVKMEKYK